jgi:putative spermidine/putrescine transport system permease protein
VSSALDRLSSAALYGTVALTLVFLLAPIAVPVVVSFSDSDFLTFPPQGFSLRWYARALQEPEFASAFRLSLTLGLLSTGVALVLGTAAAFALVRYDFRGRAAVQAFSLSPLIFPTLVTGIALLQFFAMLRSDRVLLHLVIGHVVITLPYVVRTVTASLQMLDPQVEDAARTLGADGLRTFYRVTLPLIRPGLLAGAIFAFVTSFDNFTVSMWLKDAEHVPMPLAIFSFITRFLDPTMAALSALLIVMSVVIILAVERLLGLQKAMTL